MAKRMLLVVASLVPLLARAEVGAGTFEVVGSSRFGFQARTSEPEGAGRTTTSSFGAALGALYRVTPMIGVGAEVSFENTTVGTRGLPGRRFEAWSLAPKVGVDVPLAERTALFADVKLGWSTSDLDGSKTDGIGWGLGAGFKYFLAPSFSANVGLHYDSVSLKFEDGSKATRANLFVGLGFSGYFARR